MRSIITLMSLLIVACSMGNEVDRGNNHHNGNTETTDPAFPLDENEGAATEASDAGNVDITDGNITPSHSDGIRNLDETDIDCGGTAPKCDVSKRCENHSDCASGACRYDKICIAEPSCINHFGGDTCGLKENEDVNASHESCCKSLLVPGFSDPSHPGRTIYVDKYEITSGRVRAFVESVTKEMGGKPDVKGWIATHRPTVWNESWESFLPTDYEGGNITIPRLLLGDPRHDGETNPGPGVIVPPPTDQVVNLGLNNQFGGQVFADVHGNNCGTFAGSYGFPTYYYPPEVQLKNGEVPRSDAKGFGNQVIPAQEFLDTKSMNCITNVMLAAFCAWDGGQLATTDVVDYITDSKNARDAVSGCGSQYDNHGDLLGNYFGRTVQAGGRCADVILINATFDAGDYLPVLGSSLNKHVYHYPDLGNSTSDKAWQIAAPGRMLIDSVRVNPGDEPWMDLAGNLSEAVLNTRTGLFGLRFRGIGYGSSRSDLNVTLMPGETILRVQRPEVKSALSGGRCMRFRD
jgi:hypothetical protein